MNIKKDLGKVDISLWDRFRFGFVYILLHVFRNSDFLQTKRKTIVNEIVEKLRAKRKSEGLEKGRTIEIERVSKDFTPEQFKEYVKKEIPVIISGGAEDWPCTKKWNLDYLEEKFGEESFLIVTRKGLLTDRDGRPEEFEREFVEKVKIKDFVEQAKNGGDKYMRFCPIMEEKDSLIDDFDLGWLRRMRQCLFGASYQTFIGGAGHRTPLHAGMTAFFFVMADGEKEWFAYPTAYFPILNMEPDGYGYQYTNFDIDNPDLEKYPGTDLLHRYRCHLKKGDILFLPAWYWHDVRNITESWGVSYRFMNIAGIFKGSLSMAFSRFFLSRPHFLKVVFYSFFKTNLFKRDEHLLTPRVFRD